MLLTTQADNAFSVFRDLNRDGPKPRPRGQHSRLRFSDATWPVTAAYSALLRLHRLRADGDDLDHDGADADADDEGGEEAEAEAELLCPAVFRVYRCTDDLPPKLPPDLPPDLLLELDTQLTRGQLAQLLSGCRLLDWEQAPDRMLGP